MLQHRQHHYAIERKNIKHLQKELLEISCVTDYRLLVYIARLTAVNLVTVTGSLIFTNEEKVGSCSLLQIAWFYLQIN